VAVIGTMMSHRRLDPRFLKAQSLATGQQATENQPGMMRSFWGSGPAKALFWQDQTEFQPQRC